ncbi:hypothetical protein CBR_g32487 [Chara braunii]|uniref:Uncharacterized protein n=1 Tax=Chara braunii TaxID=69332 RepID=A0A388LGR4_CHABU|nr:hypothetical protein CBR_g32487 [Chara braunii]|eukprot:GBG81498.1 hypothetical protein CBR_g32487 [Chara braunii]
MIRIKQTGSMKSEVAEAALGQLSESRLINDAIGTFEPRAQLEVLFNDSMGGMEGQLGATYAIQSGKLMSATHVKEPPLVDVIGEVGPSDYLALLLIDVDWPRPATTRVEAGQREMEEAARQAAHSDDKVNWLLVDIPGAIATIEGIPAKDYEVIPYEPPEPKAGVHRLVFVLCKQGQQATGLLRDEGSRLTLARDKFPTRRFLREHDMQPIGAVYFLCQSSIAVPTVGQVSSSAQPPVPSVS